jgi:hypothetical protein
MNTVGFGTVVGVTAELKGWTYATLWGGVTATMFSKVAKFAGVFGSTEVSAKGDVSAAAGEEVLVFGKDKASLRADGNAALYGGHKVYVGAGDGYGMVAEHSKVSFGKVTSATDFGSAAIDESKALTVKDGEVELRYGDDAKMHLDGGGKQAVLQYGSCNMIKVTNSGVLIKGKDIHIE